MATYVSKDNQRIGPLDDAQILIALRDHTLVKHLIPSLLVIALSFLEAEAKEPGKPAAFVIHAGQISRTLACAPGVKGGKIEDGLVQDDVTRGDDRFLLISYSVLSRPSNPQGRCGAGEESYLVWLRIRGSTVMSFQSAQYESCWKDISGGPPVWAGQFCNVEYEAAEYRFDTKESTTTRSRASYDSKAPEKGIQVTSQPPEKLK